MSVQVRRQIMTGIIGLLLGWAGAGLAFALQVRDDVRDLKREMSYVRCRVAVFTDEVILPPNCSARTRAPGNGQ